MTRLDYLRPAHTARDCRRWSAIDAIAISGIGGPVVFLVLRRGGVAVEDYCLASALTLAAAAVVTLATAFRGRPIHVPWLMAVLLALPFLQLIPVGPFADVFIAEEIQQWKRAIAQLGVDPPATVSLYPLATLHSGIVIAGCCGIFVLASGLVKRVSGKWPLSLAPLASAGILEALLGVRQYLHGQTEHIGFLTSAHGTFVNRDHFAVLLEACLGVAIGLALAGLHRVRLKDWLGSGGSLLLGGTALAALSLAGIVLSSSRAGIAIAALLLAAGLSAAVVSGETRKFARRALLAVALSAASSAALYVALPVSVAGRFAALWANRGDPVRLAIWADSWRTAQSFPWAGSGLGTFGSAFQRSSFYVPRAHVDHAHSDYLELLVELGFPATIFLAVVIGAVLWTAYQNIRRIPDVAERWLRGGCFIGAAAILLHAAVDFPFRVPALAMVFAALGGLAHGGGAREAVTTAGRPAGLRAVAFAGLFAGMAALAIWSGFGNTAAYDADSLFARAEGAAFRGEREQAEQLYWEASRANPFTAGIWLRRAETAGLRGDAEGASSYLALARRLEPFTLRTEWPFAQRQLRDGRLDEAMPALAEIAHAMPEMRPGVYALAVGAGIAVETVVRRIVPSELDAGDEFVRFLVERRQWQGIVAAARVLLERAGYSPPTDTMRLVLDRLFRAGESAAMVELAEALAMDSAPDAEFPWLVRPMEGVSVRFDSPAAPAIEIDFKSAGNIAYGHVYRYFAVQGSRRYTVQAEARTDRLVGMEPLRIAVRSTTRTLAVSPGLRGSNPWRSVRMDLTSGPTDRVIRVEIMRPHSTRADDGIAGRVLLRNLRVVERGGSIP